MRVISVVTKTDITATDWKTTNTANGRPVLY